MSEHYSAGGSGDGGGPVVPLAVRPQAAAVHTVYENPRPIMMKQAAMNAVRRSWEDTPAVVRVVHGDEVSSGPWVGVLWTR